MAESWSIDGSVLPWADATLHADRCEGGRARAEGKVATGGGSWEALSSGC